MNWQGKPIEKLSDDELIDAIHSVGSIDKNRLDQLDKSGKRHKAIFDKHPPVENPVFIELSTKLLEQFQLRNLKNV